MITRIAGEEEEEAITEIAGPVNETASEVFGTILKAVLTGVGLGLGLFIAKTLLERSGAELSFANGSDPMTGP